MGKKMLKAGTRKHSSKHVFITGSSGLIGSQASRFFADLGFTVHGMDNDMRQYFFGNEASTRWNKEKLKKDLKDKYIHYDIDIRDNDALGRVFQKIHFDLIIHTAAQPSHDWAAREPITDFSINALATLYLLECYRQHCPDAAFIFTSTNKVYGDRPNSLPLIELPTRYELPRGHRYYQGIDESMSIDDTKHSIFGASKVAADVMVQEYGKYFGLHTAVFRGGCLTGPAHAGTRLHGFLAYLVKCIATGTPYTVYGYKGKQVRDNIHASDLIRAFYSFYKKPSSGQVYNIGGSRFSNTSILEAIEIIESLLKKRITLTFSTENRSGDHIWYISDISKFQSHYPDFKLLYDNYSIIEDICKHGHY